MNSSQHNELNYVVQIGPKKSFFGGREKDMDMWPIIHEINKMMADRCSVLEKEGVNRFWVVVKDKIMYFKQYSPNQKCFLETRHLDPMSQMSNDCPFVWL